MPETITPSDSRITFIDIVRGVLIIFVVLGHTNMQGIQYIYWFHMPAFFMLSGALYKQRELHHLWEYSKKTFQTMFIPYFYNFILITLAGLLIGLIKTEEVAHLVSDLWKGGTYLTYIYGVFWFVSTFAISRIIFAASQALLPRYIKWPLYALMYLLAHYLAHQLPGPGVALNDYWWAPRYYLLGVPYLALGYLIREKVLHFRFSIWKFITAAIIYSALIYLDFTRIILYRFDWKYGVHDSLFLDVLIPFLGFYLILSFSRLVGKTWVNSWLARIGRETMHIMYWHLIILARLGI